MSRTNVARRRVLTFRVGDEHLAIDAEAVTEVVITQRLTRVPHAPAALAGLANVRGRVMPILSVGALLGSGPGASGGRVIVLDRDDPVGLAVDSVSAMRDAEGSVDTDDIGAAQFIDTEDGPARLLHVQPLLTAAFGPLAGRSAVTERAAAPRSQARSARADDTLAFLTFGLAGQTFALPLEQVREVSPLPGTITRMPGDDTVLIGLMSLRGDLTPLVSLRAALGFDPSSGAGRLVIAELGKARIGLVVDDVRGILRVSPDDLGATPTVLNRGAGEARITAIARAPDGLVSILEMERVLRDDTVAQVLAESGNRVAESRDEQRGNGSVEQFVLFSLDDETYGLPIAAVDSVLRLPDRWTRVPKAPPFVAGVMNHRGVVTPLIDQRLRFGLEGEAAAERRRVIVTRLDDVTVGFIVDGVERILDLPASSLTSTPDLGCGDAVLFDRIASVEVDGRLVLLVDPRQLLDQAERDVVRALSARAAAAGPAPP